MFQRPIILFIRKPWFTGLIILIVLVVLGTGSLKLKAVFSSNLKNKVIVIDPGHGGADPGAQSAGLNEKDINLDISLRLRKVLESKGCTVILTREVDKDFYIPGFVKGRLAKRAELNHRIELASTNNADLFISIHANSFPQRSTYGMETYYHQNSPTGKILAEQIQRSLTRLQSDNKRQAKAGDYYLINQSKMPAVIIEVGFISNPRERKLLLSNDYRDSIAQAIADGITNYFDIPKEIREGIQTATSQEGPSPAGENEYRVYFANSNLDGLISEGRLIAPAKWNKLNLTQKANLVLNDLIKGPTSPDHIRTLSPNTKILSFTLQNNIITLNFSKDIREDFFGGALEEDLTIKSIVWSMLQLPGINGVCILIDGEYGDSIGGHILLDHVLNTHS
ncbi:N-acetylmuramoyl-L-alanine amidase [Desulfosporosinus sp. PR]|uniref:N-acetylmuramoyl-L-alanine amidase n=1 Tax=Candidatus Desulfosporosinus nitrosoreducens TaxID=3401928 RepID=UPI0027E81890|nr:N-acetylmuramoyl-L-alanine amidase [Desulfosporosinus sp. PR]MDQ7094264.1 N-acetylmuramoyl-L-alanine amidase [Desulfosporosinus sp. PR]